MLNRAPLILLALFATLGVWWWGQREVTVPGDGAAGVTEAAPEVAERETVALERDPELQREVAAGAAPVESNSVGALAEAESTAPAAAASEGPVLRLRAVGFDGAPLAGATLKLRRFGAPVEGETTKSPKATAETDAGGRAEFALERVEFEALEARMLVDGSAALAWMSPLPAAVGGVIDLGTVTFSEPRERFPVPLIEGRVESSAGEELSGLRGWLSESAPDPMSHERELGQVEFDEDGSFRAFGPPEWSTVRTGFVASDHEVRFDENVAVPALGVRIVLPRKFELKGRLVVPEGGPPVDEYAVWVSEEGFGIGISVREDGRFQTGATSNSLELTVQFPGTGFRVFQERFDFPVGSARDLGEIDLRPHVREFDVTVLDADGAPLTGGQLRVRPVGEELRTAFGETAIEVPIGADGRARFVLPIGVDRVGLARGGGDDAAGGDGAGEGAEQVHEVVSVPGALRLP